MAGRGQSGVRMWKKAAIVKPVEPVRGKDGVKQPPYLRSHSAAQSSVVINRYKAYVRMHLAEHLASAPGEGREKVWNAMRAVAKAWCHSSERKKAFKDAGIPVRPCGQKPKKKKYSASAAAEYDYAGEDDIFWE